MVVRWFVLLICRLNYCNMLSSLFGKKEEGEGTNIFKDKVYIHSAAKMNACLHLATQNPETLFIAWFELTAENFRSFFTNNGIDASRVLMASAVDAKILINQEPVFLEHYPLHAKECALVNDWQLMNIPVYSAMDEPLFKHFGSDKMVPLIKLLGMKEAEAIEHSYVTESIIKGQNKIANKVVEEHLAASQGEWMKINLEA